MAYSSLFHLGKTQTRQPVSAGELLAHQIQYIKTNQVTKWNVIHRLHPVLTCDCLWQGPE